MRRKWSEEEIQDAILKDKAESDKGHIGYHSYKKIRHNHIWDTLRSKNIRFKCPTPGCFDIFLNMKEYRYLAKLNMFRTDGDPNDYHCNNIEHLIELLEKDDGA